MEALFIHSFLYMFGFHKKKQESEKKKSKIDKLVMGAIVGGAIGSIVGMSIAPKKGKETRQLIAQKSKDIYDKGKELGSKMHEELKKQEDPQKFFSKIKEKLLGKKSTKSQFLKDEKDLKKIPNEKE